MPSHFRESVALDGVYSSSSRRALPNMTASPIYSAPSSWFENLDNGQERRDGADGWPEYDIDGSHDHGDGVPHGHNWIGYRRGPAVANERLSALAPCTKPEQVMKAVALILDPEFGQGVERIAREMPVWVLSSPSNDVVVHETRRKLKSAIDITTFISKRGNDWAAACAQAMYDIDKHHGRWSSSHPYQELQIFGISPADLPARVMDDLELLTAEWKGTELVLRKQPGVRVVAR